MEWQPIETAPKDGTEIIVLLGTHAVSARWIGHQGGCAGCGWETLGSRSGYYAGHVPGGWMPLPAPPKEPA